MKKSIGLLSLLLVLACGTVPKEKVIAGTEKHISNIDNNKALAETKSNGVLTDSAGTNDVGEYSIVFRYNKNTGELHKITYTETTENKVSLETYYFTSHALFYISSQSNDEVVKQIYIHDGKVVHVENISDEEQDILLNKARLLKETFKRS